MNILSVPKERLPRELTEILFENSNVRIERIVSDHHTSDWYDQAEDEWVCLITGEADIEFKDCAKTLKEGDTIFIPKHQKHKITRTTKCVWLCVFLGESDEINRKIL